MMTSPVRPLELNVSGIVSRVRFLGLCEICNGLIIAGEAWRVSAGQYLQGLLHQIEPNTLSQTNMRRGNLILFEFGDPRCSIEGLPDYLADVGGKRECDREQIFLPVRPVGFGQVDHLIQHAVQARERCRRKIKMDIELCAHLLGESCGRVAQFLFSLVDNCLRQR
jgi:hypothetical protein